MGHCPKPGTKGRWLPLYLLNGRSSITFNPQDLNPGTLLEDKSCTLAGTDSPHPVSWLECQSSRPVQGLRNENTTSLQPNRWDRTAGHVVLQMLHQRLCRCEQVPVDPHHRLQQMLSTFLRPSAGVPEPRPCSSYRALIQAVVSRELWQENWSDQQVHHHGGKTTWSSSPLKAQANDGTTGLTTSISGHAHNGMLFNNEK